MLFGGLTVCAEAPLHPRTEAYLANASILESVAQFESHDSSFSYNAYRQQCSCEYVEQRHKPYQDSFLSSQSASHVRGGDAARKSAVQCKSNDFSDDDCNECRIEGRTCSFSHSEIPPPLP